MEAVFIAGLWITSSLIVCLIMVPRGGNPVLWFLCSAVFSPVLGWLVARWLQESPPAAVVALAHCPYCGAAIAKTAEGCLRCEAEFPDGLTRKLAA